MTERTTAKLAAALREIPGMPPLMLERAENGYYHDFLSELMFPAMQLFSDLADLASLPATPRNSRPLLRALQQRVRDGEFDASKEESDEWLLSPEGQQAFRNLTGKDRI